MLTVSALPIGRHDHRQSKMRSQICDHKQWVAMKHRIGYNGHIGV